MDLGKHVPSKKLKMDGQNNKIKVITANAHRIGRLEKVVQFKEAIMSENPSVIFIQEISIPTALTVFAPLFKVFINICLANDGIGIVTLVSNDINIIDF